MSIILYFQAHQENLAIGTNYIVNSEQKDRISLVSEKFKFEAFQLSLRDLRI
jgi:hypothetical protein